METENHNKGTKIRVVEYKDRITVTSYNDQRLPNNTILWSDEAEGVRNYFQKKQDMELGRWRDPENPDMVCYTIDSSTLVDIMKPMIRVLDERTGESHVYTKDSVLGQKFRPSFEPATRYYASHPIVRPWEGAKVGEYWLVTWSHSSEPEPCIVVSIYGDLFFKSITECRELSSLYIEHAQRLITEDD